MPKNLICSPGPWASDPSIHHYQPDIPHTHPEQHQPPGIPDLLPSHSTWTFPSSLTFQTSSCSGQKPGSCPWLPSFSGPRAASDPFQPQWCLHSSAQTAPPTPTLQGSRVFHIPALFSLWPHLPQAPLTHPAPATPPPWGSWNPTGTHTPVPSKWLFFCMECCFPLLDTDTQLPPSPPQVPFSGTLSLPHPSLALVCPRALTPFFCFIHFT